jgi:hypothetical protein
VVRHRRPHRPGRAGDLADGDVPAHLPVSHVITAIRDLANNGQITADTGWALLGCAAVVAIFAPLSVRSFTRKM